MRLVRDGDWVPMEEEPVVTEQPEDRTGAEEPDGAVEDTAEDAQEDAKSEVTAADTGLLEALLMGTHHPLTAGRLAELLELDSTKPIRRAIKDLNQQYADANRSFRIEQVAGGYQILTLPQYGEILKRL